LEEKNAVKEIGMNISSINSKTNAVHTKDNVREPKENSREASGNELAKVTDTASLSSLLPRLQNIIATLDQPGGNVLDGISDNISRLQDAFVESLYGAASNEGIDFGQKLTMRLDENECLTVIGEHPDKDRLEELLGNRPELSAAFKEISTQSELLKDMSNIGKIIGSRSGLAGYQNVMNRHVQASYQFSLKGDMSHFYFAKA
jgi:hypothetical protein